MTRSRLGIGRFTCGVVIALACFYGMQRLSSAGRKEAPERREVPVQDVIQRATQGDPAAQNELGDLYKKGVNVPHNDQKAMEWYRKAANQGLAEAEYNLGLMFDVIGFHNKETDTEAAEWFQKAADQGNAQAEFMLGTFYAEGRGVRQDFEEAAKWFRKASDAGETHAQGALGIMYFKGLGVARDVSEAYFWIKLSGTRDSRATSFAKEAAVLLSPEEMWALNVRIARWRPTRPGSSAEQDNGSPARVTGSGDQAWVPSNVAESSEQHNHCKQDQPGTIYTFRDGEGPTSLIERAESGDAASQDALAALYEFGNGVPKDYSEAVKWYRKAAEGGLARAQNRLGILLSAGLGANQDNVEAYAWLTVAATKIPDSLIARQRAERGLTSEEMKRAQDLSDAYLNKYGSSLGGCH